MFNNAIILLVDDDNWMQKVLSKTINRIGINNIHNASNGFIGINLAIEKQPDVIFLDLLMPEVDGLITLKMLKAIDKTKNIPVIIITSNSDFETIGMLLEAGASDFVAKPFSFTTIQDKLIKTLNDNKQKQKYNTENTTNFDDIGLENDDARFFDSFSIDTDLNNFDRSNTEQDTDPPPRMSYKNLSNTYTEPPENEISKILQN